MPEQTSRKHLRLLIIEDSEDDAKLIIRDIQKAGYDIEYQLIQTSDALKEVIDKFQFDLVISDYNMPEFNGIAALRLIRQNKIDIPFILVSGVIGEELAVEAMKEGASDYIMKSYLKRLVPAIEKELTEYRKIKSAEYEKQKSIALSIEAERQKSEALQLIDKASKMASIGIITSAITHEINQPLNAIKLGADGILLWDKKNNNVLPESITKIVSKITHAANKIDEIIKHMRLLIVDDDNVTLNLININDSIKSSISLVSDKLASQEIILDFSSESSELNIKANNLQIELIVNNLIQNAAQSIMEKKQKSKKIKIISYKKEHKIYLEVQDNGIGLPDVPIESLFDPLFSTKKHKGGTGLGLAIIYRFLKKIDADIIAINNEVSGATFIIVFNEYNEKGIT